MLRMLALRSPPLTSASALCASLGRLRMPCRGGVYVGHREDWTSALLTRLSEGGAFVKGYVREIGKEVLEMGGGLSTPRE